MGANIVACNIERCDPLRFHVNYAVLILEQTFDRKESGACDDDAVTFKNVGSEDNVGDAGLIFKREEDEPFGGAWTLAAITHPAMWTGWLLCLWVSSSADKMPS
jgi:hypothetical protein